MYMVAWLFHIMSRHTVSYWLSRKAVKLGGWAFLVSVDVNLKRRGQVGDGGEQVGDTESEVMASLEFRQKRTVEENLPFTTKLSYEFFCMSV